MTEDDGDNHLLLTYLNEKLPNLGLDAETYAPYVMGCFENINYDNETNNGSDESLEESVTEIIGLLQASSESHSDDESSWEELKGDILKKHLDFVQEMKAKKNEELMEKRKMEEITRQKEIEAAKEAQREMEAKKQQEENKEMSEAKKALLAQYAYDTSEQYDNDGNLIDPNTQKKSGGGLGEGDGEEMNNKAMAQKIHQEKVQNQKKQSTTSKNEERIKTKNAKLDKMKQKEERRKRTAKGERRR